MFDLVSTSKERGHYNEAPPNLREITEKEFAQSHFFMYNPEQMETRQVHRGLGSIKKEAGFLPLTIYWFHDGTGVCFSSEYWAGKVRYFKCGCDHKWDGKFTPEEEKKIPRGRCMHSRKCSKCGHIDSFDSSD